MNEMAGVRKKLRRVLGREVPDDVWEDPDTRDIAREYLEAKNDLNREDTWGPSKMPCAERCNSGMEGGKKEKKNF